MVVGSIGGIASTYFSYGELTVDAHLDALVIFG
jgi:hypothetical protein